MLPQPIKPSTVADVIKKLKTLPPTLPVFSRPIHSGCGVCYPLDMPVNTTGIIVVNSPTSKPINVTFLV